MGYLRAMLSNLCAEFVNCETMTSALILRHFSWAMLHAATLGSIGFLADMGDL